MPSCAVGTTDRRVRGAWGGGRTDDLRRPARSSRRAHTRACRAARPGERVASQVEGSGWEQRRMGGDLRNLRSEEHTSELQSLMRISYAVFCLHKKNTHRQTKHQN